MAARGMEGAFRAQVAAVWDYCRLPSKRNGIIANNEFDQRSDFDRLGTRSGAASAFGPAQRKRRFVRDGEVPVTVVRRHGETDIGLVEARAALVPAQDRIKQLETTLAAEIAGREHAQRALQEAHATIRDLKTKLGHAELARQDALAVQTRAEETHQTVVAELRQQLEAAATQAPVVRAAVAQPRDATGEAPIPRRRGRPRKIVQPVEQAPLAVAESAMADIPVPAAPPAPKPKAATRAGRKPGGRTPAPQPVKWWIKNWKASLNS